MRQTPGARRDPPHEEKIHPRPPQFGRPCLDNPHLTPLTVALRLPGNTGAREQPARSRRGASSGGRHWQPRTRRQRLGTRGLGAAAGCWSDAPSVSAGS